MVLIETRTLFHATIQPFKALGANFLIQKGASASKRTLHCDLKFEAL